MKKLRDTSAKIGAYIISLGIPFTHIFGYIGLFVSLPTQFEWKNFKKYKSLINPILIFLIYLSILSIFQSDRILAFKSVSNYTVHWLLPLLLGISLGNNAKKFIKIYIASLTILILIGFGSAIGVFPCEFLGDKIWSEGMLWCFHHHNALASVLVIAIPVAAELGGLFSISAIIFFAGLILTGSRGYFLTIPLIIIGVLAIPFREKKYWKKYIIIFTATILAICSIMLLASRPRQRIESIFTGDWRRDLSTESRFGFWQIGLLALEENPVFGIGPGQLEKRNDFIEKIKQKGFEIDERSGKIVHLHNFYLTVLAENGIIGLLLFLWIIYSLARKIWNSNSMGKIFIYGYFAFLMGNFFDSQFRGPTGAIELFFLSGLIMSLSAKTTSTEKSPKR
ncbi:O-antigen ligase family protein [bacterium]|nr:O-antigen ligase family protein [bacterium]